MIFKNLLSDIQSSDTELSTRNTKTKYLKYIRLHYGPYQNLFVF